MNDGQQLRLTLLKEIHDICQKNHLTYFLAFGTQLGAVRNGGFIPWDDDADIYMTCDQWKLFREACKNDLPPNRYLGSADTDDTYNHMLPRYMSTDTTVYHANQSLTDSVAGEVIDIFILDPIADGRDAWRAYIYDVNRYDLMANYAHCTASRQGISPEEFDELLAIQRKHGKAHVCKLLIDQIEKHHSDEGRFYAVRYQALELLYERSWFEEAVPIEYEGVELMIPKNTVDSLAYRFGDQWFNLPSRINPAKHHAAMSYRFSYTEALEYFHPKYSREELLRDMETWRRTKLGNAPLIYGLMDERSLAGARAIELSAKKTVDAHRDELLCAIEARDGQTISKLIGTFMVRQASNSCIGSRFGSGTYRRAHPIIMNDDKDLFDGAVLGLLCTNRMSHAARILETCIQEEVEFTPVMNEVWSEIKTYRSCLADLLDGHYEQGLKKARELHERYPGDNMFLQLNCAHLHRLIKEDPSDELRQELDDCITIGLERYPDDGYYHWVKTDMDIAYGKLSENDALPSFTLAAELTLNGFVLRDIATRTGYHPLWMRRASWSKAVGISEWKGPEPTIPSNKVLSASSNPQPEQNQKYLFDLLVELCDLCDKEEIEYVLSPALAKAFYRESGFPTSTESYAIACSAYDAERLIKALGSNSTYDGRIRYMGNDKSIKKHELEFHAESGLDLSLAAAEKPPYTTPFIRILLLDPEKGARGIVRLSKEWRNVRESEFRPKRKALRILSSLYRIPSDRAKAGSCIFALLAKRSRQCNEFVLRSDQTAAPVRGINPSDANSLVFYGRGFRVPANLDGYIASIGNRRISELYVTPIKHHAFAPNTSLEELIEAGGFDPAYYDKKRELRAKSKRGDEIKKRFNDNFHDLSMAVVAKDISIDLLPRKAEIVELFEQRRFDELEGILADYIDFAHKNEGSNLPVFDEKLSEIMEHVRERNRKR